MTKLIMAFMIIWMFIASYAIYWMVDGMLDLKDKHNVIRNVTAKMAIDVIHLKGATR